MTKRRRPQRFPAACGFACPKTRRSPIIRAAILPARITQPIADQSPVRAPPQNQKIKIFPSFPAQKPRFSNPVAHFSTGPRTAARYIGSDQAVAGPLLFENSISTIPYRRINAPASRTLHSFLRKTNPASPRNTVFPNEPTKPNFQSKNPPQTRQPARTNPSCAERTHPCPASPPQASAPRSQTSKTASDVLMRYL
jgi:hypothetical protein